MGINRENMLLWVKGLESGDFPQGTGVLRRRDTYCCLGVATEVAIANGVTGLTRSEDCHPNNHSVCYIEDTPGLPGIPQHNQCALPSVVKEWLGVDSENPVVAKYDLVNMVTAWGANDRLCWSFPQIARSLRDYYGLGDD